MPRKRRIIQLVAAVLAAAHANIPLDPCHAATPAKPAAAAQPADTLLAGKRFTVRVTGDGPDVILIPGLSTSRGVWDGTVKALAGKYRLHLIQIRGFGDAAGINGEGPVLEPFIAELADYIDDEITGKGRAAPAIIGHSLGGLSALMIGARHPHLAGRLMIVDSLPFIGTMVEPNATVATIGPKASQIRDAMLKRPAKLVATPITADPGPQSMEGFMAATPQSRIAVANLTANADQRVSAQMFYENSVTDMRPDLPKITAPVTLLYAHDASLMPAEAVKNTFEPQFAGIARFTAQRVDNSRHFIMLDQPAVFQDAVRAFLKN
jgi:pimeloyl-ACP methyl ester carboxylesterase